jgi:hypothetical protein
MTVPRCHLSTGNSLCNFMLSLKSWCTEPSMYSNAIGLGNAR